jgi:hypothetical protein
VVGPRTQPESTIECQNFRIHLRSLEFVNQDLEDYDLNANLKNFTYLAKQARQNFIKEVFMNKNRSFLFRPIPITNQEAEAQKNEKNMTNGEILVKIETLLGRIRESTPKKYPGLRSKKKEELLEILAEVKSLVDFDDANNQDCLEILETDQQE